jgi:ribosomal protein S13
VSSALGIEKSLVTDILERLNIPTNFRAEQLKLRDFSSISDELTK